MLISIFTFKLKACINDLLLLFRFQHLEIKWANCSCGIWTAMNLGALKSQPCHILGVRLPSDKLLFPVMARRCSVSLTILPFGDGIEYNPDPPTQNLLRLSHYLYFRDTNFRLTLSPAVLSNKSLKHGTIHLLTKLDCIEQCLPITLIQI